MSRKRAIETSGDKRDANRKALPNGGSRVLPAPAPGNGNGESAARLLRGDPWLAALTLRVLLHGSTCAAAAALIGGCTPGPASGTIHFVSPTGSDRNRCSVARPCASFDRAYRVARPGDIVIVRGGKYKSQRIPVDSTKERSTRRVVFRAAKGERVQLSWLEVHGKHVSFERLRSNGWYVKPGAQDVVFRNVTTTDSFYITSASDVSLIGGSVGPGVDKSPQIKACTGCPTPPRNILISGVRFHDWVRQTPGTHVDCLHVMAVDGLVVRKSRFQNCEHFDILFTRFGSAGTPENVRLENNVLSCCRTGYYSVYLGGGHDEVYRNFMIRNNSTDKAMAVCSDCTILGDITFYSNIAPSISGCDTPGVHGDYNVLQRGLRCGSHSRFAANGFVNAAAFDFRLKEGAQAIDHGHPHSYPRTDILSRRRPLGSGPDVGAYEAA